MIKKTTRGEIGGVCNSDSDCVKPTGFDKHLKVSCKKRTFKKKSDKKYLKGKMRSPSCMMKKCCWTDPATIPPKSKECEGLTITLNGEKEFVSQSDLQDLIDELVSISRESRSRSSSSNLRSRSSNSSLRSRSRSSSSNSRSRSRSRSSSNSRSRSRSSSSSHKKQTRKRVAFAARNNIIGSPRRRSSSSY